MSIFVLGEVKAPDAERFLAVFGEEGAAMRAKHGCLGARVYRPTAADGTVRVLLEWPDEDSFVAFRSDPETGPTMAKGGAQGPPSFTLLEHLGDFDH